MLYSNKELTVENHEMKFGVIEGISVGEYGRGRREVLLPTPKGLKEELEEKYLKAHPGCCEPCAVLTEEKLHYGLTIGTSKSGRPRINRGKTDELYLILSSERDYTRRGCGCIMAPKTQWREDNLIARGNGADGDAGRIGTWDVVIVKAHEGDVFRVTWGGYGYGYPATFYVVRNGEVRVADQPEIEDLYEAFAMETPFSLRFEERLRIDPDEWVEI